MFTETERTILNALPPKYKYIFRTRGGNLRISERFDGIDDYLPIPVYNHLFKNVMADGEPVRFREPILDDAEREYLKAVFKPFASRIKLVKKQRCNEMWEGMEYIKVLMKDPDGDTAEFPVLKSGTMFPVFKSGTMYKYMSLNEAYTLEELGITYD